MAETHPVSTWNPLDYFSPEELARLDKRFDTALRDAKCLVFWTGLSLELAHRWADQHELQTLTIAMGSLFSDRNVGGARYGKSPKGSSCVADATSLPSGEKATAKDPIRMAYRIIVPKSRKKFQRKETTVSLRCPGPHHLNLEASYQNNLLNREVQFLKLTVHKAINIRLSHNPEAPLFSSGSQDKRNLRAS
jgi:hypothetical protein